MYEQDGKWHGFEMLLAKEALTYKGHTISLEAHMPNARLQYAVSGLDFDVSVAVQAIGSSYLSDDFITYENFAISRTRDKVTVNSIADLVNYRTVAWQNAYMNLGDEYTKYFGPEVRHGDSDDYMEFSDQQSQNAFFWLGRADVIVVDRAIFHWYRRLLSKKFDTSAELTYHEIFPQKTNYQVAFKKKSIRDDFNEGLKFLRSSGKYQEIVDRYLSIPTKTTNQN